MAPEAIKLGSLVLLVFEVKEDINGSGEIVLYNLSGDLFGAEDRSGSFVCEGYSEEEERSIELGRGNLQTDGTLAIPVVVSDAFNLKSFGIEFSYNVEKMQFLGGRKTELTSDFIAVDGNEVEKGTVRVGGYSASGIQERGKGTVIELIFLPYNVTEGAIEIRNLVDDIDNFYIKK